MPVFRVQKSKNYTVMSNYHLKDKNLSFKAKGMLSFMLSLPDDWDYSLNGLCSVSKEGIRAIKSILNELKEYNYLEVRKTRNQKGFFEYEYLIYERPYTQKTLISKELLNDYKNSSRYTERPYGYGMPVNHIWISTYK